MAAGGGAWKVAYADFVTAMMAFFLVMWIVAQSDKAKEAIAHHFNDPFSRESDEDGTAHQKPPRHPAPARSTKHPEHEKEAGGSQSVLLTTQGGQRTSIGMVVHFADETVDLDAEAHRRLEEIVPLLVGKPQKIEVRGHSSRRPIPADSPFSDHWRLSYERCLVVMTELENLGIPRDRVRLSQAAGNEPLTAPDEQLAGGGYARVEVSLLNETTGAKVAQPSGRSKPKLKITPAVHDAHSAADPHATSPPAADAHAPASKPADPHSGNSHGSDAHGSDAHSAEPKATEAKHGSSASHGH
jgi:chemotaxis protein MotB